MNNKLSYELTLLLIVSGAAFASSIVAPCLPLIISNFNLDSHLTYFIVSTYLLGYLSGQIIHSFNAQINGYRLTLLAGFSIYVISSILQIIAIKNSFISLFFISRFLCALGASSGLICVFAMINTQAEEPIKSQNLISKAFISLTLCSYLSITAGGFIIEYLGWRFIFYIILAISLLKFTLIYYYIPCTDLPIKKQSNFHEATKKLVCSFVNLKFLSSCLIVTFTTTSTYLYHTIGSFISIKIFHVSSKLFGLLSVINLICLLFGGWISTKIMKKFGPIKTLYLGVLIVFFPVFFFLLLHSKVFATESNGWCFFSLISTINLGVGIIYPAASFLALSTIKCGSTASSVMNFIKIGIPTLTISVLGHTQLSLIESYKYSMFIASLIAIMCTVYLNFTWKKEIS